MAILEFLQIQAILFQFASIFIYISNNFIVKMSLAEILDSRFCRTNSAQPSLVVVFFFFSSSIVLVLTTLANRVIESKTFHREKMNPHAWEQLNTTTILATDGVIQCGQICLNKGDSCNIFHFDKGTKMCTYGQVKQLYYVTHLTHKHSYI